MKSVINSCVGQITVIQGELATTIWQADRVDGDEDQFIILSADDSRELYEILKERFG